MLSIGPLFHAFHWAIVPCFLLGHCSMLSIGDLCIRSRVFYFSDKIRQNWACN
jgi:hypothetical protein